MRVKAPQRLGAMPIIRTMPYPGFPTDAQAPVMAAATVAEGASVFVENIFENRFKYQKKLQTIGEGAGISRLVKENCDFTVSMPMVGRITSLNASNAAAVLMYEVRRQRDAKK